MNITRSSPTVTVPPDRKLTYRLTSLEDNNGKKRFFAHWKWLCFWISIEIADYENTREGAMERISSHARKRRAKILTVIDVEMVKA